MNRLSKREFWWRLLVSFQCMRGVLKQNYDVIDSYRFMWACPACAASWLVSLLPLHKYLVITAWINSGFRLAYFHSLVVESFDKGELLWIRHVFLFCEWYDWNYEWEDILAMTTFVMFWTWSAKILVCRKTDLTCKSFSKCSMHYCAADTWMQQHNLGWPVC